MKKNNTKKVGIVIDLFNIFKLGLNSSKKNNSNYLTI
jgi:hypothetical protein